MRPGIAQNIPRCERPLRRACSPAGLSIIVRKGFRIRSPHWLFSEEQYLWSYAGYDDAWLEAHGYPNGYAHFLSNTVSLTLTAVRFLIRSSRVPGFSLSLPPIKRGGIPTSTRLTRRSARWVSHVCHGSLILTGISPNIRRWRRRLQKSAFKSALHHYLTNDTPERFDPLPQFSESAYREASGCRACSPWRRIP